MDLGGAWQLAVETFATLAKSFKQSRSINVNSAKVKATVRQSVQQYFRLARPELVRIGLDNPDLVELDDAYQDLLRLSHGNNPASSYRRRIQTIRSALPKISGMVEYKLGASQLIRPIGSASDTQIIATLHKMLPSAAASYAQAVDDLADHTRTSFRGAAVELRECMREVLHHFAPDEQVVAAPNFKLEKDQRHPTMRQRVRFILKARDRDTPAIAVAEDAVETIERGIPDLTRSVYVQGSAATHVAASQQEVMRFKRYVEALLFDLLEL
jgi:hypothetical protein